IRFSSAAEAWRAAPVTATAEARAAAFAFAGSLEAAGSTALHDALALALAHPGAPGRPHVVFFITDGLPTTGESDPAKILVVARALRADDAEIGRLFTMRKVAALLDRDPRAPLPGEVRDEVVALAKRFRLATPLTSFFIPEPPERRTAGGSRPGNRGATSSV